MLSSPTLAAAAQQLDVDERTLLRWRKQKSFQQALEQACRENMQLFQQRAQMTAGYAFHILLMVAADARQPGTARVAACRTIIEAALRTQELQHLRERLTALEAQLRAEALDGMDEAAVNAELATILGIPQSALPK
jgi:hypothetical protein